MIEEPGLGVVERPEQLSILRLLIMRLDRRTILALYATTGFLAATIIIAIRGMPATGGEPLMMMLGCLVILVKDAYGYDFNTTSSSASKDDTIKQAALSNLPQTEAVVKAALSTETKGP